MRTRQIIIVTIILTAICFVILRPVILSAQDSFGATKISPLFMQPEILQQNYQTLDQLSSNSPFDQSVNQPVTNQPINPIPNQPFPNLPFDQSVNQPVPDQPFNHISNQSLSNSLFDPFVNQYLTYDPFDRSTNELLPTQVSQRTEIIDQPAVSSEVPLSFSPIHRKVTGPIIYDTAEGEELVTSGGCSPVCAPGCGSSCDVSAVEGVGLEGVGCCGDEIVCVPAWYSRVKFYGWLQGGLYANSHGSTTERYHGINRRGQHDLLQRPTGGNGASLGNVRQTGAVLNQLWLGLSRELDLCGGFDWGFRGEFLFGTDARLTQSYGDATFDYLTMRRDYGFSIPQLYVTLGYRCLSVKVGKFESLLGFEHIQAVDSPFYSHSNLFYAEPQSHSGVLFDCNVNPDFWFSMGYVQGADSTLSNRFGDNGLIGGIYWRCCPSMTLWYTIYYSKNAAGMFANGEPHAGGDLFRHTFVLNWKLTSRFDYAFQWDVGNRRGRRAGDDNSSYFGWAQYFTYKIHPRLNGGIRIDQLHSNKLMATSGFARPNTGNFIGNLYGITIGIEWKPYQNFSFKPELRYDYSDTRGTFGNGKHRDQISFGFGIVYDF
ncbi:MAG: outer membrane beta-barrel protein [Planctomycetaceae bacterium]|nr:outer membrane beta-barrel protein [Planctomycetaceae bacterium]